MSYKIIWSQEAKYAIIKNIDYLSKEWSNQVLNQFLAQVETALEKIAQNPQAYPPHKTATGVRFYKINKRIILYYRIKDNSEIGLITFWNTYQNPENLKL